VRRPGYEATSCALKLLDMHAGVHVKTAGNGQGWLHFGRAIGGDFQGAWTSTQNNPKWLVGTYP